VQSDGMEAVLRPRAEDAGERRGGVVARVDRQNRAVATVEPGEYQDLAAGAEVAGCFRDGRIELEPGRWRALVALLWGLVRCARGSGRRRWGGGGGAGSSTSWNIAKARQGPLRYGTSGGRMVGAPRPRVSSLFDAAPETAARRRRGVASKFAGLTRPPSDGEAARRLVGVSRRQGARWRVDRPGARARAPTTASR
jgi:hypothetical protein